MQFLCVIISIFIIGLQAKENVDVDEDGSNGYTWQYIALKTESQIKQQQLGWSSEYT